MKFCTVNQFLAFVALVDGRSSPELCKKLGVHDRTIRKYIRQAKALGVQINMNRRTYKHEMVDPGPFDIEKLSEAVLPKPSMGALLMRGMQ